jgi:acyl-CoA synthetase (NDP forming)
MVGVGGLYAEIVRDVAVTLAPADEDEVAELVRRLRVAPLLAGARGRPPLDVAAAARAGAALSRAAAEHPEISEIEVNPLLVLPEGCLALDARIVKGEAHAR